MTFLGRISHLIDVELRIPQTLALSHQILDFFDLLVDQLGIDHLVFGYFSQRTSHSQDNGADVVHAQRFFRLVGGKLGNLLEEAECFIHSGLPTLVKVLNVLILEGGALLPGTEETERFVVEAEDSITKI